MGGRTLWKGVKQVPPTVTPSTPGSVNQPIDWHGARESAPLKTPLTLRRT